MIRFLMRHSFINIKPNSFIQFAYLTSSAVTESSHRIINETIKSISDKYTYFNLVKSKKVSILNTLTRLIYYYFFLFSKEHTAYFRNISYNK